MSRKRKTPSTACRAKEKHPDASASSPSPFALTSSQVVTGLATLQAAVQDLSRAYIAHTNTVLGRAPGTTMDLIAASTAFANPLGEQLLLAPQGLAAGAKAEPEVEEKKRKKRAHDPNAPKRPLTPYFLYMQSARQVIASDLGDGAKPGQISEEGTRRWKAMDENEKQLWKNAYEENLIPYRKRTAAYKATLTNPDDPAAQLAAENGAASDEADEAGDEPVAAVPPPAATPKAANKRRKSAKAADDTATKQTPVLPPSAKETAVQPASAAQKEKEKSPDKKRKRSAKGKKDDAAAAAAAAAEAAEAESAEAAAPEKGKRSTKRKRKSEAVNES